MYRTVSASGPNVKLGKQTGAGGEREGRETYEMSDASRRSAGSTTNLEIACRLQLCATTWQKIHQIDSFLPWKLLNLLFFCPWFCLSGCMTRPSDWWGFLWPFRNLSIHCSRLKNRPLLYDFQLLNILHNEYFLFLIHKIHFELKDFYL